MLANDRHANAEAQAGAAAGALGGEERIKNLAKNFRLDADTIVLNGSENARSYLAKTNLDATGGTDLTDGLLGIADQIKKNLNQLIGIADRGRKSGKRMEIDLNGVAAKRMLVKLKGAIDDGIEVESFFLRRGWA